MVEIALSCLQVIPVFWAVHVSKYCLGGFSESILGVWEEFRNIDNAREFKVPALSAATPVTKSRRVIANFIPPQRYSRLAGNRLHCPQKNTSLQVNRPDGFIWPVGWNFS
jgi:hypothetical protein